MITRIFFIISIILAITGIILMWNLNPIGFRISFMAIAFLFFGIISIHYKVNKDYYK